MAFLSLLDDRAKPKGTRDPLGFEKIWTHYGRQVIGNLTTITSSLNNFAVAMLGFQWANELHANLPENKRQTPIQETFLKYEQLTGYLRYLADDRTILGITRVSSRMDEANVRVSFGTNATEQILSDQASYGLWGLYSDAMRKTGLVTGNGRTPTELGKAIAQEIEFGLDKAQLINLLTVQGKATKADLEPYAIPFVDAIKKPQVKERLLPALMKGNEQMVMQQELWKVTQKLANQQNPKQEINVPVFIQLVKRKTQLPKLKQRLSDIESVERVLVAANNIFHYCRRKDGESVANLLDTLDGRYSYAHLPNSMHFDGIPSADLLTKFLNALRNGHNRDALNHILLLNQDVMKQRGGAAWVEIENGNTLRVRVPSESSELRDQQYLETGWDYDYFLGSFIRMAIQGLGAPWTLR